MTTLDRINQRAADRAANLDMRKVLLFALMMVPYAIGWTARKIVMVVAWSTAWFVAAVAEGWAGAKREPVDQAEMPPWMAK